ncbi:hypothetical protein TorRG33x02_218690 [Trema orientale]|uniref:Uncharacterized protein n=1 Tax=Trema orientale TaxID=63057 RepID=A0A2P5EA33_TREOI|nr:hypothetical protein TorRG33x02_218690 [Trema orientale]
MPPKTKRKRFEKGPRDLSEEEAAEEESSSEMTQSTRTTTLSTWGTRVWNRRETTLHRPRALTSPILLKTRRRSESGRRSKWSIMSMAMESGSGYTLQVRSGRMDDIFRKRERRGPVGIAQID